MSFLENIAYMLFRLCTFFGAIWDKLIKFDANSALKFKKFRQKQHLLKTLFGTNLVSKIIYKKMHVNTILLLFERHCMSLNFRFSSKIH